VIGRPESERASRVVVRTSMRAVAVLGACFASTAAAAADPVEVVVQGSRPSRSATVVRAEDVRTVPGAFGDPGRVVESMPGISPIQSLIPFYFVRGATPSNTGYWIDGIRVPFVSHTPPGGSSMPPPPRRTGRC
jgi:hypothetical protein